MKKAVLHEKHLLQYEVNMYYENGETEQYFIPDTRKKAEEAARDLANETGREVHVLKVVGEVVSIHRPKRKPA